MYIYIYIRVKGHNIATWVGSFMNFFLPILWESNNYLFFDDKNWIGESHDTVYYYSSREMTRMQSSSIII
jgi:hypothetical protein